MMHDELDCSALGCAIHCENFEIINLFLESGVSNKDLTIEIKKLSSDVKEYNKMQNILKQYSEISLEVKYDGKSINDIFKEVFRSDISATHFEKMLKVIKLSPDGIVGFFTADIIKSLTYCVDLCPAAQAMVFSCPEELKKIYINAGINSDSVMKNILAAVKRSGDLDLEKNVIMAMLRCNITLPSFDSEEISNYYKTILKRMVEAEKIEEEVKLVKSMKEKDITRMFDDERSILIKKLSSEKEYQKIGNILKQFPAISLEIKDLDGKSANDVLRGYFKYPSSIDDLEFKEVLETIQLSDNGIKEFFNPQMISVLNDNMFEVAAEMIFSNPSEFKKINLKGTINNCPLGTYILINAILCQQEKVVLNILDFDNSLVNIPNAEGETPLVCAALIKNKKIIEMLLAANARFDTDENNFPQEYAEAQDFITIIFLEKYINILRDKKEFNPLAMKHLELIHKAKEEDKKNDKVKSRVWSNVLEEVMGLEFSQEEGTNGFFDKPISRDYIEMFRSESSLWDALRLAVYSKTDCSPISHVPSLLK